jgi:4-hydroxy-tetrahydrodipicolinate reductase
MLFLVLGRGKTGSLVAQVAKERGHGVRVDGEEENSARLGADRSGAGGVDAVIERHKFFHRRAEAFPADGGVGASWRAMRSPSPRRITSRSSTRHRERRSRSKKSFSASGLGIDVPIESHRVGDAKGEHVVRAVSDCDVLELRHDAHSRRGFALGAVRGAEWLAGKSGAWEFREIFGQL